MLLYHSAEECVSTDTQIPCTFCPSPLPSVLISVTADHVTVVRGTWRTDKECAHHKTLQNMSPHRERDKTTVMNLHTAHSFWDRSARDFEALVRKSGSHPNTTGCKFEKDLVLIIKTGALLDSAVKSFEQTFIEGKSFSDEGDQESGRREQQRLDAGRGRKCRLFARGSSCNAWPRSCRLRLRRHR